MTMEGGAYEVVDLGTNISHKAIDFKNNHIKGGLFC